MQHFYTLVKILYYILTVLIGVFFLRGDLFLGDQYATIISILVPGYLLLTGIMFGYIMGKLWMLHNDDITKHNAILLKSFIIGTIIGIALALIYMFFG